MSSFDSAETNSLANLDLREQNRRLKEDLEECKSQLNELLQEDNGVSDTTIKTACLTLYDSIETWIGSVSHSEEEDFFHLRFRNLLQRGSRDSQGKFANLDLSLEELDLLATQDSSNCVVLSAIIWKHLESSIFKKEFPIGTMKDEITNGRSHSISFPSHATLLKDIIAVMEEKNQNQDGSRRVNKWRSETLTAMVETKTFKDNQWHLRKALTDDLLTKLDMWISPGTLDGSQNDLVNDIIVPAVNLHQDMKCSSTKYDLCDMEFGRGRTLEQPTTWHAKDIKTWTQMSNSDTDWVPFLKQFPGLYRLDKTKRLELIKPTVIVLKKQDFPTALRDSEALSLIPGRSMTGSPETIETNQPENPPRGLIRKHPTKPDIGGHIEHSSHTRQPSKRSVAREPKQNSYTRDRGSSSKSSKSRPNSMYASRAQHHEPLPENEITRYSRTLTDPSARVTEDSEPITPAERAYEVEASMPPSSKSSGSGQASEAAALSSPRGRQKAPEARSFFRIFK